MCSENVMCPLCCHSSFENVDSLRKCLIKAANTPISCPECNEMFLGLDKLTIHLFSHSNSIIDPSENEKLQLLECSDPITCPLFINANQPTVNSTIGTSPKCNFCGCSFRSDEVLKMHYKLKHQKLVNWSDNKEADKILKKNPIDNSCIETICTKDTTIERGEQPKVAVGGGILSNSSVLNSVEKQNLRSIQSADDLSVELIASTIDMKLNESAKIWECNTCSKAFTTKYFLKKHKRLHTGEMPYNCEICGRAFTFQQSYHKHLLYHSDDKPHVCQTCHRAFKELSTLHNHERIHSGEKPFKCEICGKSFRQRVSFLVHTRIHTGAMPYKCSDCEKSFRYKLSLRTHKCLPLAAESENNISTVLFRSNKGTPAAVGDVNAGSTETVQLIEKYVTSTEREYDIHSNYFSKTFDEDLVPSCTNMEIGPELQNFNGCAVNNEDILEGSTYCPSEKFQDLHLYPPLTEENAISHTGVIIDTAFPQFLYDIESSSL